MSRAPKRSSAGRRKIQIKFIEDRKSRMVTLCKRRNGILKKANELATLCGVQMAIILTCMGDRVYSFGSPSVDTVVDRYLHRKPPSIFNSHIENHRGTTDNLDDLNRRVNELSLQLDEEEKTSKEIDTQGDEDGFSLQLESMNQNELNKVMKVMLKMKENIARHRRLLPYMSEASSSSNVNEVTTNHIPHDNIDWSMFGLRR